MTRSFSRLRTVMETALACTTSPWKRSSLGFAVFTVMGLLTSTCAQSGAVAASSAALRRSAQLRNRIIERNLQRLQEADVLRRHVQLRRLALFVEHFLVHLDVQRFQEVLVLRGDLARLGLAL